ncbi:MAG TPA: hypothetical protein VIK18_19850, partial [Pirellulales bacterium]
MTADANISNVASGLAGEVGTQITLSSGGLLFNEGNTTRTLQPSFVFNNGYSNVEAFIFAGATNGTINTTSNNGLIGLAQSNGLFTGGIATSALTKFGGGDLTINSPQAFSGPISINGGGVTIFSDPAGPGAGNTIYINDGSSPEYITTNTQNNAGVTLTSSTTLGLISATNIVLAAGVPYANALTFSGASFSLGSPSGAGSGGGLTAIPVGLGWSAATGGAAAGSLTFGGSTGPQGQQVVITTTTNGYINGQVNLSSVSNASSGINMIDLGSGNLYITGQITGGGTFAQTGGQALTREGVSTLVLSNVAQGGAANTFTGGIVEYSGMQYRVSTDQANVITGDAAGGVGGGVTAATANPITILGNGTTTFTLDGGMNSVNTFADTAYPPLVNTIVASAFTLPNPIYVDSQSTINVTTNDNGAPNQIVGLDLTVGSGSVNQALTLSSTLGYTPEISQMNMIGDPEISNGGSVILNAASDGGAGFTINKISGGDLFIASTNYQFSGGLTMDSGSLLFVNNGSLAGTGTVTINPGAVALLTSNANVSPGQLQVHYDQNYLTVVRLQNGGVNPTTMLSSTSGGLLELGTNYAQPLAMSQIGNGTMFLGSSASVTYSATTLGAGNYVAPNGAVSVGSTYWLGGGASTL